MIIFKKKFFIVGYNIFLIILFSLCILLINKIFLGWSFDKIVVKLLGFFNEGFDIVCILIFILLVMILDNVVLFNLGGLKSNIWFNGLWWSLVVLINIFKLFFIEFWLIYCCNFVGLSDNLKLVFLLCIDWLIICLFMIIFFLLIYLKLRYN